MRPGVFWFLVFVLALGALIAYLIDAYPGALNDRESSADLIYSVIVIVALGSAILGYRGLRAAGGLRSLGFAAKSGVAWVAIVAALVLGYSYRHELGLMKNRIVGEMAPASPISTGKRRITVRAGPRGKPGMEKG